MARSHLFFACVLFACEPPPTLSAPMATATAAQASTATPTPGPALVAFGRSSPAPGDEYRVITDASSDFTDEDAGNPSGSGYASVIDVEILAVAGATPTKLRAKFVRNERTARANGGSYPTRTPLDGQTLLVDGASAPPAISDASGAPVGQDVERLALDIFVDTGTRPLVEEALPDDPMRPGDRADALALAILRILNPRTWTLRHGTAQLTTAQGGIAVFATSLEADTDSKMRVRLHGTAKIRQSDRRLTDLALLGTFSNGESGSPKRMNGTMTVTRRVEGR